MRRRNLSLPAAAFPDPEELLECLDEIKTHIHESDYEPLSVTDALIDFDYKNVSYKLFPCMIGITDGVMESAAGYILGRLRALGADYGHYYGRLD